MKKLLQSKNTFEVNENKNLGKNRKRTKHDNNELLFKILSSCILECIVYTWDHRTSAVVWNILKVQPLLSDEVQTFKALITVHKIIKDGHPNVTSLIFSRISFYFLTIMFTRILVK